MSEYKTLEEERAALVKRIEEIDAEASFKPGWYFVWDKSLDDGVYVYIQDKNMHEQNISYFKHVEPFHKVAHKFLPPGWKVVPPETGNLYDWSKAPDWAGWAATDEIGFAWWYERKPEREDVLWNRGKDVGKAAKAGESVVLRQSVPWDQSLEQRPEGV